MLSCVKRCVLTCSDIKYCTYMKTLALSFTETNCILCDLYTYVCDNKITPDLPFLNIHNPFTNERIRYTLTHIVACLAT